MKTITRSPIRPQSRSIVLYALSAVLLSGAALSFAETPPWERLMEPTEPDTEAIKKAAEAPKVKPAAAEPAPPPQPAVVDKKELEKREKEKREQEKRELEKKEQEKKAQEKEKKEQEKRERERLKKEKKEQEKKEKERKAQEKKAGGAKAAAPAPAAEAQPAPAKTRESAPPAESKKQAEPAKPETSAPPAKSAEPAKPETAPKQTEPVKPAEPAKTEVQPKSAEPAKTEAPPKPAEPAKAETPPKPAEPAKAEAQPKPAEPAKTETQPKSAEPAKAAAPAKPAEPAKTETQPKKPAEPAKAAASAKPAEPAKAEPQPAPAEPVKVEAQPKPAEPAASGTVGTVFETSGSRLGVRAAIGIGGLMGHEPVRLNSVLVFAKPGDPGAFIVPDPDALPGDPPIYKKYVYDEIGLGSSLSGGVSLVLLSNINDLLGISCELQYSFYFASGESVNKTDKYGQTDNDVPYWPMSEATVELHSLEVPVLLRINAGTLLGYPVYAEVGPQFGFNVYARKTDYADGTLNISKPNLNVLTLGPVLGAGFDLDRVSVGLRLYIGLIEYVKSEGGRPWSLDIGVTSFF